MSPRDGLGTTVSGRIASSREAITGSRVNDMGSTFVLWTGRRERLVASLFKDLS